MHVESSSICTKFDSIKEGNARLSSDVYLDSLHLKFDVTMFVFPVKLCVSINVVHGSDVVSNQ